MYIAQYQNVIRIKIGTACLAQKGEPRSTVCTYSGNMINDVDHNISRVPYFSTVCVYNESYSYATSLFTVALALRLNPLTCQTWGVNWNEQQHWNGSNQMAQIKLGPRLHDRPAWAGLCHCIYLCTYNFTHPRVMVPIALPELHLSSRIKSINENFVPWLVNIVLKWAFNASKSGSRASVSLRSRRK